VPWAESIREELTAERMPPWYVDARSAAIKGGPSLSAREIEHHRHVGHRRTPEGDLDKRPRPASVDREWAPGRPDLIVPMEREHTGSPRRRRRRPRRSRSRLVFNQDAVGEGGQPAAGDAVDRPRCDDRDRPRPILAVWVPSEEPDAAPSGTAFRLPPDGRVRLRMHYKKSCRTSASPSRI